MVSSYGATTYDPSTGSYTSGMAEPYIGALASSVGGASNLFNQISRFSPAQRQQEIFREQAALLQPEFQRQAAQLQGSMFGGGRLGLRLAGQGVGASGAGGIQPDAFGLAQAQQQTLGNLLASSRQQGLEEASTLGDVGAKMLTTGLGISELENQLMQIGIDAETARAVAAGKAGEVGTTALADIMSQRYSAGKQRGNAIGTAISAGLKLFSDENLKTDIKKVGELDNGLGIYTWKWNAKAKELGADSAPQIGVIAQEVLKVIPDAVERIKGYLTVNYSKVLG